ncbi:MAG: nitronate monooxygenase, partial [Chloroflexi bacterium]|nr:nitronate monooxygenase [Chloroflexota bacterium]
MHSPLHTPICDLLDIEYPIFLAGMGGVSMSKLVAAVSNAGGLGILGAATLDPPTLREEIHKTRELTDKPFAVDLLAPDPEMIRPHMQVVFEEGVKIFVAGLAVPEAFIAEMHERDMLVMVMCGRVRHAQKSVAAG